MSTFQFESASETTNTTAIATPAYITSPDYASDFDDDEVDNLPYPTELPRSDFLKPNFDPQEYLSSLRDRHQALEDLQSDLRSRSQLLNQELLDLVNGNYEEFLSLGADLNGGEDKVEGVRVGLLGFNREVETLKASVVDRESEFRTLLDEGKQIRQEIVFGRQLLEVEANIEALEESLGIVEGAEEESDVEEEEEEEDDDDQDEERDQTLAENEHRIRRLDGRVTRYLTTKKQIEDIGATQPFLEELRPRYDELRKTLLLDLSAALRHAKSTRNPATILVLTRLFSSIDAEHEAIQILKAK